MYGQVRGSPISPEIEATENVFLDKLNQKTDVEFPLCQIDPP